MLENLSLALTSLQTALSIAKSIADVKGTSEAQSQLIDFNEAIINAQGEIMQAQAEQQRLSEELSKAKAALQEFEDWSEEAAQYARVEIADGIFAYLPYKRAGSVANAHKYCATCFEQRRKSTLQQFRIDVGRRLGLRCSRGCPDLQFTDYLDP